MTYLDRVVADARNPDVWRAARLLGLGASDAASFSKIESVPLYVKAKIRERLKPFTGNRYTETGNQWEISALAGAGWEQNHLLFHAEDETGFLATPDGIRVERGEVVTAESKTALVRLPDPANPKDKGKPFRLDKFTGNDRIEPAHRRQMWWAQYVTGAVGTRYIVLPYDENHTPLEMLPRVIEFDRDEREISKLVDIARPVLAALRGSFDFERNAA